MIKKHSISLIIAVTLIMPVTVFAVVNWLEKKWSALPVYEGEHYTLSDFQLLNQAGEPVTLQHWKGQIVVANFFFTHCPVVCPKMTANLQKVKAAFPGKENILINSFSVDPVRDSVPQLTAFAERFGISGNWNLLTGDKRTIYHLARNAFAVAATEGEGDEHDFIHTDKLVLIDSNQKIRGFYNGTSATAAQKLIEDINKLQDEK